MSYIVSYEPDLDHRYPVKEAPRKQLPVKKILLLIFVCGAIYGFVRFGLTRYLVPGDPEITEAAFSNMLTLIKEGETVNTAVTTFIQEVVTAGR